MARFPKNDIISLIGTAPRYDLGESVVPNLRLNDLLDGSCQQIFGMELGYGTAEGNAELRTAIAEAHGVGPDDVVVTVGGMHALFLIAFILCERGDEAVTASPQFPLARNALDVVGANVRTLRLSFDRGYQPNLADLRRLLSDKTKLVSLASPQNPSGVAMSEKTMSEILGLMADIAPDAYLLMDETYHEAAYGHDPVGPSAAKLSPKVISCASLSKCHGAPGLRLGWAITRDPALREQLILGKFNTVISCSPVDELFALRLFRERERIIDERRLRLAQGLASTSRWVSRNEAFVEWVRPNAGAICCVRLKSSAFDDDAVTRFYKFVAEEGVRVGDGTWFGEDARVFRLGFGLLSMSKLDAALNGLSAAITRAAREGA